MRTVKVRIEGHVQGVGFRAFVERAALNLGLDGWVRNRRDGGVEALFSGAAQDVEVMLERCRRGPHSARVDFLRVFEETSPPSPGFDVLPTV
jgi:acylphosphatase